MSLGSSFMRLEQARRDYSALQTAGGSQGAEALESGMNKRRTLNGGKRCCGLSKHDTVDVWMTWARGCRTVVRVFLTPLRICYDWSDRQQKDNHYD